MFKARYFLALGVMFCLSSARADEAKTAPEFNFGTKDVKAAILAHIRGQEEKGIFTFEDKGKKLSLKFLDFSGSVRELEGKGHFICSEFDLVGGAEGQRYDLDFWVRPDGKKLKVTEGRVHREPVLKNGKWTKKARYSITEE